jgi:diguanylate cyclase (GGDEF)-like protein/putative nucleotidyltransferase with HDIG domain
VFGSLPRVPRPIILILVYGVFLVLVGITATAQSTLVSSHFSVSTMNAVVGSDAATTRAFVNAYVPPGYLDPAGAPIGSDLAALEARLASLTRAGEIVAIELRATDGTLIAGSGPSGPAIDAASRASFLLAAGGRTQAAIVDAGSGEQVAELVPNSFLREYLPLSSDGTVRAVVVISRDASPIIARLEALRMDVVIVTLSAGLVAALLLYLVFRSAQGRLTRQTAALVESTRRDPLTGLLNHGAVVGILASQIESAKAGDRPVDIALIDIDNFRLLNDNHGPAAGDAALQSVATLIAAASSEMLTVGRSGPDEFLLIAEVDSGIDLELVVRSVMTDLAEHSLVFETTERLPITVSAALCRFPAHGASMTVLLATAARTLEDAKASGGDTIVSASRSADAAGPATGFDVLQGLVHAVDTKDRYTMRHSADVSRYAAFIAEQLRLDVAFVDTIRLAGLLHDVGKIGIPDSILRKPGRLTAQEESVVRQHVALGDMIVRDVPNVELVRDGIRNHHERWDGNGYLERLAGTDIPLIGRILAVADTFSAMTTTRPYRKALDVREAMKRLEDAAGTQLDEDLVKAFIVGIETAADPPLPELPARARLTRLHVA